MNTPPGVSFVVPVYNGEAWLEAVLAAIFAQADGRPMEIIAIDDGSRDQSRAILERYKQAGTIKILDGEGRGAAAAINLGVRHAAHPIVCQVDQDVVVHAGWMARLTDALVSEDVGAAQGYYLAPRDASIWSRVMGLDLEYRYGRIQRPHVDHVCTGNTAYRASALADAGFLDEGMGYGYDNDISYRLVQAGYRLVICPEATSTHEWRDNLAGYLRQQYGFGYGRLDLVAKHRRRLTGDDVSRVEMMLHAPVMATAVAGLTIGALLALFGYPWFIVTALAIGLIAALALERFAAGFRAAAQFRDPAGLLFAPVHLVRDLAWTAAIVTWLGRRIRGGSSRPAHSMHPRAAKIP
jgi:cellulose synthase/poly-beta-1,6-N-acetylglucosamine synthase-like glycosyltransferase